MTRSPVTLRGMRSGDIPTVMELERTLFPEDAWSEGIMRTELAGQPTTRHYLVAEITEGGVVTVAGYAGLAAHGPEADVQTIGVLPRYQGGGVGAALLGALLDEAARRYCTEVFLEVRADNLRARKLYEAFGFVMVGTRPEYYQPAGVDALVMRLDNPRDRRQLATRE